MARETVGQHGRGVGRAVAVGVAQQEVEHVAGGLEHLRGRVQRRARAAAGVDAEGAAGLQHEVVRRRAVEVGRAPVDLRLDVAQQVVEVHLAPRGLLGAQRGEVQRPARLLGQVGRGQVHLRLVPGLRDQVGVAVAVHVAMRGIAAIGSWR